MDVITEEGVGWTFLHVGFVPVASVISIAINFLLGLAIKIHGKWNTTAIIFFSLTVSDFFCGVFSLIGSIFEIIYYSNAELGRQIIMLTAPYFYLYIYIIPKCVSILLTALLSIERLIAVLYPLKMKSVWTKKRVKRFICCCVVFSILLRVWECFKWQVVEGDMSNATVSRTLYLEATSLARKHTHIFNTARAFYVCLNYVLPTIMILTTNVVTACSVNKIATKRKDLNGHNAKTNMTTFSNSQLTSTYKDLSLSDAQSQSFTKVSGALTGQGILNTIQCVTMHTDNSNSVLYINGELKQQRNPEGEHGEHFANRRPFHHFGEDNSQNNREEIPAISYSSHKKQTDKLPSETATEKRVTITILLITSVFLSLFILELCTSGIFRLYIYFKQKMAYDYQAFSNAWTLSNCIALTNSILNTIIYFLRTKQYKTVIYNMVSVSSCCHEN